MSSFILFFETGSYIYSLGWAQNHLPNAGITGVSHHLGGDQNQGFVHVRQTTN